MLMANKKDESKFTLQFSKTDPSHLKVAEILNQQGRRSKAQYIVNAVMHYENCSETPHISHTADLDIKTIEAIVNRILREREQYIPVKTPEIKPLPERTVPEPEEIKFDDALESFGTDELNAIADVLSSFRKG